MKKKLFFSFVVLIFLSSCQAPRLTYPEKMPTPIYATVPILVQRGEIYLFSVETEPEAICYAGISFWDTNENWVHAELPVIKANDVGVCQWEWEIPQNTKNSVAGFRGYVKINGVDENFFPETFCIGICPEE
ncbi:MAG: hypothetical protein ACT6FF_08765 [Methanosarcinaceae archaeon]